MDKTVSLFPNIYSNQLSLPANLIKVLTTQKYKDQIIRIRESNGEAQRILKLQLPCFTPTGIFGRRTKDAIVQLSGLAAVDLDSAEDYDTVLLLKELKKISCIAYAGLSCRGRRLFAIVPFKYPNLYERHYERLIKSFEDIGLPMGDDCHKSISQARFVSWNTKETSFINHFAIPYQLLQPEKKFYVSRARVSVENYDSGGIGAFDWCKNQIEKSLQFIPGFRHKYLLRLVRYCNLKGVSRVIVTERCEVFVQDDFDLNEIRSIVKYVYENHQNSFNKYPYKKIIKHES